MEKNRILLQPSEWLIMEELWRKQPQTIMQLYHCLKTDPGWSKSTVITMLGRMVNKKIIYYEEGAKARQYYPQVERDEAAVAETNHLLQRVYRGSVGMLVDTMIRNRQISREEFIKLLVILDNAGKTY